jgi:hypothetical protein
MGKKDTMSMSSLLVSSQLQRYWNIFQILDSVWCFLMRNKTPCTLTNLKKMIRCESESEIDLKIILQRLEIICHPLIILAPTGTDLHLQDLILSYSQFNGISKVVALTSLFSSFVGSSKSQTKINSIISHELLSTTP